VIESEILETRAARTSSARRQHPAGRPARVGDLDCAFSASVTRQHGLTTCGCRHVDLDEQRYRSTTTVEVKLDSQRFASVRPVFRGDVIRYAFTIPANAPDAELAREFVAFALGPDGRRILTSDHQPLLTPPVLDDAAAAPDEVSRE
jgi:ABC-type molybdate transport system substrate-binding protein